MKADTQRRPGSKLTVSRDHAKERTADRVAAGAERIAGPVSEAPALPDLGLGLGLNLPTFERRYFEQHLGTDLGGVRLHPDSGGVAGLSARALASGRDIAFAPGAWRPGSGGFTQLLGHELAHTAQQRQTGVMVQLTPPEPGQGNAAPGQTTPQPDQGNSEPGQGNTNQPASPAPVPAVAIAGLTPAINDVRDLEMELANGAHIAASQARPNVGKVMADYCLPDRSVWGPRMVTFNKAIDLVQVVQNTAALMGSGKTQASEAGGHVKAAVGLTSAASNLVPLAGSLGLEMSTTIPFMADKCMIALGKIEQTSHRINKDLIETGDYDHVNWAVEPGGRPMFDFMRQVMAAGSADGVPTPVPAGVAKYFVENRDDIATGVGGEKDKDKNAVPTQRSWVFWREADQSKLPACVFGHRRDLWTIFYGDIQPLGGPS